MVPVFLRALKLQALWVLPHQCPDDIGTNIAEVSGVVCVRNGKKLWLPHLGI